jgi:hypothetical protein
MSSSRGRSLKSQFVALVFLVVVAAASADLAHPLRQTVVPSADTAVCGVERWAVKTLQDRPRLLPVYRTTVRQLVRLPRPAYLPSTRLPIERHVYSVVASATLLREEDDQDFHVILRSGPYHMISEAPNAPSCTPNATPYRKAQMRVARSRVRRSCARARVIGVAFFDYYHGQTGVAPNVIELHPILAYTCLSVGTAPPRPPRPPRPRGRCAASYPTVCIPPPPPDLNCADIPYRNFRVLWNVPDPDPHHFDGNRDGVGCET